jgi:SAM-dependent methyltransferase
MWEDGYGSTHLVTSLPSPETKCGTFEFFRVFRGHFPAAPGLRFLEMGCGGSKYLPWFAREMGYAVDGIDYTQAGCEAARRNLAAAKVSGTIYCEDFLDLPNRFSSRYDIVMSLGVIEHFADPSEVLRAYTRCLKDEGFMLTFVPNMRGLVGHILKRVDRPLFDTHCLFDRRQFEEYHRRAGLEIVHATYCEWLDLALLPFDKMGHIPGLIFKNLAHYANRSRLLLMKRFPSFNPQSPFFCSGMTILARKPRDLKCAIPVHDG